MSAALSDVTMLFGQRAGDLEKAREVFTAEIRGFVSGVLAGVMRVLPETSLVNRRVKVDPDHEIDTENRTGYVSNQMAIAPVVLRFKKETKYMSIADVPFGIQFDQTADAFKWHVSLVPSAKYPRLDDVVWRSWKNHEASKAMPGAARQEKANILRFVSRALDADLTHQVAFSDVKQIFEFLLATEADLAEAIGLYSTEE